ncbi:MAG: PKD domain-containing protein [Bacteroidia bacterium]|nr:PKD domain-containing protein [Bacteroidia bacterium]
MKHTITLISRMIPSFFVIFMLTLCFAKGQQQYLISTQDTVTTCAGNFYDSGGDLSHFSDNESYIMTFCSGSPQHIQFNWLSFNLPSGDTLFIYDGPSLTDPLFGKFSGPTSPPQITSYGSCLTFHFVSDSTITGPGWNANISCTAPPNCNMIITSIVSDASSPTNADGSIDITVTGGMSPFQYNWSNSSTTEDLYNIPFGQYSVTVTDYNNCQFTGTWYINDHPCSMILEATTTPESAIGVFDGSIDVTVINGIPPFVFNWSNGITTEDQFNLSQGDYQLTVTDSTGCIELGQFKIFVADTGCGMFLVTNIMPVTYPGGYNGAIELMVQGGTPPYTFFWSNEQTSPNIYNLYSGQYDVTVIDANQCHVYGSFYVEEMITGGDTICTFMVSYGIDTTANPLQLQFYGYCQAPVTNYSWNFDDGTGSNIQNPVHLFPNPGFYWICFTVFDSLTQCQANYCQQIVVGDPGANGMCAADFSFFIDQQALTVYFADSSLGNVNQWQWNFGDGTGGVMCYADFNHFYNDQNGSVFFNDASLGNINSWYWNFGDGSVSTEQNPSHIYTETGVFQVCLMIFDTLSGCQAEKCKPVQTGTGSGTGCYADFYYYVDTTNTVYFTDNSMGNINIWNWNFGDGAQLNQQNPAHTYPGPGVYNVCLFVKDTISGCQSDKCFNIIIGDMATNSLCYSDFSFFIDFTANMVNFFDQSLGNITSWYWNFGDGEFSELQNPTHFYQQPGFYQVCLTTFDSISGCQSYFCKYIQLGDATMTGMCFADYTFIVETGNTVYFQDQSVGQITHWFWNFGDGNFANISNPVHTYTNPGFYQVCLAIKDTISGCQSNICYNIQIGDIGSGMCFVDFIMFA